MRNILSRLSSRFCDGWQQSWRWWSVRLHVLATALVGFLQLSPQMPPEIQKLIPQPWGAIATAAWLILGLFAEKFLSRGSGTLVGVSSVAGDRGRASNYVYGSAKAGFSAFLSGLRARASRSGVHVVTVKPGFVRTRMTEGMKLIGPLTVEAPVVGAAILRAVENKTDIVYVSGKWRLVMLIIKTLPEAVFKKLKF